MKIPIPERLARSWATFVEEQGEMGVVREVFVSRCLKTIDQRAGDDAERRDAVFEKLALGDLYLATGCLAGHRVAMQRFLERFQNFLRATAHHFTGGSALGEEVESVMLGTLFTARSGGDQTTARLHSYGGMGSLQGWLRITTRRVAIDLQRRVKNHQPESALARHDSGSPGAEALLASFEAAHKLRPLFLAAIDALPAEDRDILRFYYRDNLVLREIGERLDLNTTGVFRRLERARGTVFKAFKTSARTELGLDTRDITGLLSQIATTLRLDDLFAVAVLLFGMAQLSQVIG